MDNKGVINVPKQILGGAYGSGFKVSHEEVGNQWAYGRTNSSTMYLFIILTLECEKGNFKADLRRMIMLLIEREVLLWSSGSCCSLPQVMLRAGSTRTDVKRAFTT